VDGAPISESVTWISPVASGERRILDRWCETVGTVVVTAAPAATSGVAAADVVAIISWNMHVGGGNLRRLIADLEAGRLTDGQPMPEFVLLLQEAHRSGPSVPNWVTANLPVPSRIAPLTSHRREDIVTVASSLGLHLFYVPSMRNGRDARDAEDRGNAILSTLPLTKLRAYELPFERQRRVALAARAQGWTTAGHSWSLDVVNVHLENRAGRRRWWLRSGAARARQVRALLDRLPEDRPMVLGGDLNTWGGSERALEQVRERFEPWTLEDPSPTFRGMRLDYLFVRLLQGVQADYRVLDDAYGSDHHPLIGVVRWQNRAL
jgi:endonuclease/exonuclease/phosphatase family metal-dependent hydrolase